MSLTEALLVVVILILLVSVLVRPVGGMNKQKSWDCVDRNTGEITSVDMKYTSHGVDCDCTMCARDRVGDEESFTGTNDKHDYDIMSTGDFADTGMDYRDWVTSQSIDRQVVKNHSEFVKDRLNNNTQNIAGKTYSPDSHDSYDPIPWTGLRRPQAVAVNNPTQVPDVDYSLFTDKPKFTWSST